MEQKVESTVSEVREPNGDEEVSNEFSGVITELAELPEKALLTEEAMARILGVSRKTIQRMVERYELPPAIHIGGKNYWIAGRVLAYLDDRAAHAERELRSEISRIRKYSPRAG